MSDADDRVRFLATILGSIQESIIVTDLTGQILHWNEGAARVFGFDAEEMLGGSVLTLYRESVRDPAALAATLARVAGGESFVTERSAQRKDGTVVWLDMRLTAMRDASGEVTAIVGVARDATERRRVQEALVRQEARFRLLMERTPDATLVHRRGAIIYANPALLAMLGYDEPELYALTIVDLIHPDDLAMIVDRAATLEMTGKANPQTEVRLVRKTREATTVEFSALPVDFDGEPAIVCVARDVTVQREMQARLMVADRMASVGTLAAGVAHEINNPLTYVISNVAYALEELAAGRAEGTLDALRDAGEGAERVRRIVLDLKAFSRPDEERTAAVALPPILRSAAAVAGHEIRHRARFVESFGPTPLVLANDARLGQVVVNLLVNAAQAIPEGAADRHEIRVTTSTDEDGRAVIEVSDTGVGIPRALLRRIFDPFFTTKPIGQGTGLGLPICHRIVTTLGGHLDVESTEGAGTTVRIVLPAAPGHGNGAFARLRELPADPSRRRGRVLIIDDEPLVGSVIRRTIQPRHDAITVTSGREALDRLARGETFDVVVCDLMMPVLSGMDVHAELTARFPALAPRMIFVTGGAFTLAGEAFLQAIRNPRLTKPFAPRDLLALVDRMMESAITDPPG